MAAMPVETNIILMPKTNYSAGHCRCMPYNPIIMVTPLANIAKYELAMCFVLGRGILQNENLIVMSRLIISDILLFKVITVIQGLVPFIFQRTADHLNDNIDQKWLYAVEMGINFSKEGPP